MWTARVLPASWLRRLSGLYRPGGSQRDLIRSASGTFTLRAANAALMFMSTVLLARILGVKDFGAYSYALAIAIVLIVFGSLGTENLLVRNVAAYQATGRYSLTRGIIRHSLLAVSTFAMALAALAALASLVFHQFSLSSVNTTTLLALLLVPLIALVRAIKGALQGFDFVIVAQLPELLVRPAVFLALIVASQFILSHDLTSFLSIGLYVVAAMVALAMSISFLHSRMPADVKQARSSYSDREWLKSAMYFVSFGGVVVLNKQISVLMLGSISGKEAVGLFSTAVQVTMLPVFGLSAINMSLRPIVSRLHALGDYASLQETTTSCARLLLLYAIPCIGFLVIFAEIIMSAFGPEFVRGSSILRILCIGEFVNLAFGSVALLLNMTGHESFTARAVLVSVTLNAILNAILIPLWGAQGAATATAATQVVWNLLLAYWVYSKLGIRTTALGGLLRRRGDTGRPQPTHDA